MDPLGAQPVVVDAASLVHWHDTEVPEYDIMVDDPSNKRKSPFPCRNEINRRIVLWSGDLTAINTEAIVNSTNEAMTDKTPNTERIFRKAGPELQQEIRTNIKSCKTGEAKITKGYRLAARYVIHTVGPRYNLKYKTAAESALFNSYRSVFQVLREYKITSIGLPCIHSLRRGYPNYEGAHIAIRTVRRFLEKYALDVERVVLVVVSEDEDVYLNLMPLYFPRSQSEEDFAAYHLPYDVGNEDGEPTIAERQIRIAAKPMFKRGPSGENFEESVNINEAFDTSIAVGAHSFSRMEGDIDKKRRMKLQQTTLTANPGLVSQQKRYEYWLRRSKQEDLGSVASMRCFFQSGFDVHQRPVVVFIAKYFNQFEVSLEKAAMYFISIMDQIVNQAYVVVYIQTEAEKENTPEVSYIKEIYNLVDRRYKNNLRAFYFLHPTFWSKMNTWFMTTFMFGDLKGKVHNIPGVEYLYSRVPPDQLDIPEFVMNYDERVNGTRYYTPEKDQAIGSLCSQPPC